MQAHRIETVVQKDGSLIVKDLPFDSGEVVEVIILSQRSTEKESKAYPLRNSKVVYHDPFKPVVAEDWDADK